MIHITNATHTTTIGYAHSVPTDKPILNFVVDEELLKALDDFRYANRFPDRAKAVKWLLRWALEQKPKP